LSYDVSLFSFNLSQWPTWCTNF